MDELTKLVELFRKLGASPLQAGEMARQLARRADQMASERGQSREESMAYLLRLVVQGHAGHVPPEFGPAVDKSTQPGEAGTKVASRD